MADLYVNSDELKEVASSMKLKANNIMEAYQNEASAAILMGKESIQVSGLDTTELLNSLSKIFNNLNGRIISLSDFLNNVVANEYDNVSASIKNEFDNNFANEIAKILGISLVGGGTGNISNIISGRIDSSSPISIREDGTIIRRNEPPVYEIPPQPKPKLETMGNGKAELTSDNNLTPTPSKDSSPILTKTDNYAPIKPTKANAITEDNEYVTGKAAYYARNGGYRAEIKTANPNTDPTKATAISQTDNGSVTQKANYYSKTGGYNESIKNNYANTNPTKAAAVTQKNNEFVTQKAAYYTNQGGYTQAPKPTTTPKVETPAPLPNVSTGNRRPVSVLDNNPTF